MHDHRCALILHGGQSQKDAIHVYIPQQIGSHDSGVYVCMFEDLIEQKDQIAKQTKDG